MKTDPLICCVKKGNLNKVFSYRIEPKRNTVGTTQEALQRYMRKYSYTTPEGAKQMQTAASDAKTINTFA